MNPIVLQKNKSMSLSVYCNSLISNTYYIYYLLTIMTTHDRATSNHKSPEEYAAGTWKRNVARPKLEHDNCIFLSTIPSTANTQINSAVISNT